MNKKSEKENIPTAYDYLKSSSAQDCTGLIPRGIEDESEIENYEEIYPFLPKAVCPDHPGSSSFPTMEP